MFKLFGKKAPASPEEQLAECRKKRDWKGLAIAYYDLGRAAMDQGDLNRAQLWLHRADTVYSALDEVYEAVGDEIIDDCSDRIGQLEDTHILYNDVPSQVEEKAAGLGNARTRVWGLLSMARLADLGKRLSTLPGCEVLGRLDQAVDTVLASFQAPPGEEALRFLKDLSAGLYQLGDSPYFWGTGAEIAVPGGAPFQVFDLNGMLGVPLEVMAYINEHLDMIQAISQGGEPPQPETGIIACTFLPDYHVRTGSGRLEEVPQVQAELARIWNDYDFICSSPSWEATAERISAYKALDILA